MGRFIPAASLDRVVSDATRPERRSVAAEVVQVASESNNDDTGAYDRSLGVFEDRRGIGAESTDFAAHIIEWGDLRQAAQAPIRTGAEAAGRFEER